LIIKTDAFQQPSRIRVDRDPGSDLSYDLCLLEDAYIETSRPKRERSGQTSDSTAGDCNAKRTGHFTQTFAVNRKHGPCGATGQLRLSANSWLLRRKGVLSGQRSQVRASGPTERIEGMTQWRDRQIAAASSLGVLVCALDCWNGSIEFKAVAFGATLLSYTIVKFNQEKNEVGTRVTQRGVKPLATGDRLRRLHCRT
jgi:hypothetical protein